MLDTLNPTTCPDCGTHLSTEPTHQPALFIACGYGATRTTIVRYCRHCGWTLNHQTTETRPTR